MECEKSIIGTCQTMCSLDEIKMREKEGRLHQLESSHERRAEKYRNRKLQTAEVGKMIKEYSRPAAGCHVPGPESLRPAPVLLKTVQYIFNKIIPRTDHRWAVIYDFSFDRLRAVRQDMVIQRIEGLDGIVLLESCVRFHIYAGYRLGTANISTFDPVINSQHAQECLKRLLVLYDEVQGTHKCREQFESIYLLYNLGDMNALRHCLDLKRELRHSLCLRLAFAISASHMTGNYVRTIRLACRLPCPICQCAFHRHLKHIQQCAIRTMSSGFSSKNTRFPCSKLQDLLAANCEDDIRNMATTCGLNVSSGFVCFQKSSYVSDNVLPTSDWAFLEEKLSEHNISDLLMGETDRHMDRQTDSEQTDLEIQMQKLSVNPSSSSEAKIS
ncbi:SAC3 domain-containing protein 1-like [Gigantopelta aegis]|uniref:SAC3 domain-containing protein 1-like n=1 Tax=Gigantopelta aegis TaxID=1735272 RepID=UPI001B88A532|nr:SAC3 domain-containing protein 1-like [Gigantopelta aegis]